MERLKNLTLGLAFVGVVFSSAYLAGMFANPTVAGIKILSNAESDVYVDDKFVGKTPFTGKFSKANIDLRLVPPAGFDYKVYETKLKLTPGVQTFIKHEFASNDDFSSDEIVSFSDSKSPDAGLVVLSKPSGAEVWIGGVLQGNTPYFFNSITVGTHPVTIKYGGYLDKNFEIRTVESKRLTLFLKLAKEDAKSTENVNNEAESLDPTGIVEIKEIPSGYVKLRTNYGTEGDDIALLKPGEKFPFLEKNEVGDWYKIIYKMPASGIPKGIVGWVPAEYSRLRINP